MGGNGEGWIYLSHQTHILITKYISHTNLIILDPNEKNINKLGMLPVTTRYNVYLNVITKISYKCYHVNVILRFI